MYRAHLCVWLAAGGVVLAGSGCTETKELTGPGAMPVRTGESVNQRIAPTTYFAHGHLLERQGSFERAAKQYRDALELTPDFVTARNRLGITLNKLGRHEEASAEFRRAIAVQPQAAYLHNNLGFSLYLEGKYSQAEAATRRALEIKASFPRARMNHALALAKLERFDEAFAELCRVGNEADAYYNMAMMQTEAGRYADAAHALDMALRLNPRLEAARQQLREIAVLAARQETVPVADAAADPDVEQTGQPQSAAEPSEHDVLVEAEAAILAAETATDQPPEQAELASETGVTGPPAALDMVELFPEPEPPGWLTEPEPTEPPAEVGVFHEPPEADVPELTIEAADDTAPAFDEGVPSAWRAQLDRPYDSEAVIEMIGELITAIVNRSEALAAELWCELETYLEAAEQQEQPQPAQLPEPADLLN